MTTIEIKPGDTIKYPMTAKDKVANEVIDLTAYTLKGMVSNGTDDVEILFPVENGTVYLSIPYETSKEMKENSNYKGDIIQVINGKPIHFSDILIQTSEKIKTQV